MQDIETPAAAAPSATVEPTAHAPASAGQDTLEFLLRRMRLKSDFPALSESIQRINEIVRGKRGVSPETAWLFARALGTTPEFWTNLQVQHDLARTKPARGIRRLKRSA